MLPVILGIALALAVLGVMYLIARGATDRVAREQAEAITTQEVAHREALEQAAAAERTARAEELEHKIQNVRTPEDAAQLVREQLQRRKAL